MSEDKANAVISTGMSIVTFLITLAIVAFTYVKLTNLFVIFMFANSALLAYSAHRSLSCDKLKQKTVEQNRQRQEEAKKLKEVRRQEAVTRQKEAQNLKESEEKQRIEKLAELQKRKQLEEQELKAQNPKMQEEHKAHFEDVNEQATSSKVDRAGWNRRYAYIYDDVNIYIPPERMPDFNAVSIDAPLTLKQEPSNQYDQNAVIIFHKKMFLGYIFKGKLQTMINDFLSQGFRVDAKISKYNRSKQKIYIKLMFPYKYAVDFKTFKLTGNTSVEMQESISCCNEDEIVTIEYDAEKDKYMVSSIEDIGYLPKSAEKYISEDDTIDAIIDSIEPNDNDKEVVTIALRLQS